MAYCANLSSVRNNGNHIFNQVQQLDADYLLPSGQPCTDYIFETASNLYPLLANPTATTTLQDFLDFLFVMPSIADLTLVGTLCITPPLVGYLVASQYQVVINFFKRF